MEPSCQHALADIPSDVRSTFNFARREIDRKCSRKGWSVEAPLDRISQLTAILLHMQFDGQLKIQNTISMVITQRQPELDGAQIVRPALHAEVIERLRDLIADGTLPEGDRLNERVLCDRFGISRTPLREALIVLQGEGLVTLSPRKGAHVTKMSLDQIRETLELIGGLETIAAAHTCKRASAEQIRDIKARHAEMVGLFKRGDMLAYFKVNECIHLAIVAASANSELVRLHATLRRRVVRALYSPLIKPERWRESIAEHEGFIVALQKRDGARLGKLLAAHALRTWEEVQNNAYLSVGNVCKLSGWNNVEIT